MMSITGAAICSGLIGDGGLRDSRISADVTLGQLSKVERGAGPRPCELETRKATRLRPAGAGWQFAEERGARRNVQ
jgi:hypothetical protein